MLEEPGFGTTEESRTFASSELKAKSSPSLLCQIPLETRFQGSLLSPYPRPRLKPSSSLGWTVAQEFS